MDDANSRSITDTVRNSSLYKEFAAERDEILKHKWIESEKARRDVGFEWALTDWIIHHRSKWRKARKAENPSFYDRYGVSSTRTTA